MSYFINEFSGLAWRIKVVSILGNGKLLVTIACVVVCMLMEGSIGVCDTGINCWWRRLEDRLDRLVMRLGGDGGRKALIIIKIVREGLVMMLGLRIAVN